MLAGAYWFLANRGLVRWLALVLVVAAPVLILVTFALHNLLWVAIVAVALMLLAAAAARTALSSGDKNTAMPATTAARPRRPFLIMNPRSGGGKVARFGLKDKAEAMGAEVALLEGPGTVDVAALARQAAADGADLLGVAGGDGTQALVAEIAAEHDLPFLVISAGTRNHFALDLGLDRDDPATCLEALTHGEELHIDLGTIGGRTFVNNASFGAYAKSCGAPPTEMTSAAPPCNCCPTYSTATREPIFLPAPGRRNRQPPGPADQQRPICDERCRRLRPTAAARRRAIGRRRHPRRQRASGSRAPAPGTRQRADHIRCHRSHRRRGLPEVPVGIDGETVMMPTPVRCAIRPGALRVVVPRQRPGVPAAKQPLEWPTLKHLASFRRLPDGGPSTPSQVSEPSESIRTK